MIGAVFARGVFLRRRYRKAVGTRRLAFKKQQRKVCRRGDADRRRKDDLFCAPNGRKGCVARFERYVAAKIEHGVDHAARERARAAEGADREHGADEEGIPHLQKHAARKAAQQIDKVQKPERGAGCDDGGKAALLPRARIPEHEGKEHAAERRLLEQPHAQTLQRKQRHGARAARDLHRTEAKPDKGQVVERNGERGERKQESAPFPFLRQERAADAHVKGERKHDPRHDEAQNAQPEKHGVLLVFEKQIAQPLRGKEHQPRDEQI